MKNENWKIIGILLYNWVASAYWWLAWNTPIGNEAEATRMWVKAQSLKAGWCARYVYYGSGWHGLHCEVDGKPAVVQVTLENKQEDSQPPTKDL